MLNRITPILIVLGVACGCSLEPRPVAAVGGSFTEQRLWAFPGNARDWSFSQDLSHVAVVDETPEGKQRAIVDGRVGPECDELRSRPVDYVEAGMGEFFILSPDGRRVAYIAVKGQKELAVVDGQAGPEFDGIDDSGEAAPLVFSPDGKHVAYAAWKGEGMVVVADGQAGPEFDSVGVGFEFSHFGDARVFSPDSEHFVYVAYNGPERHRKWMVVVDGRAGPQFDRIVTLDASPDGKHIAYIAARDSGEGERFRTNYFVVVDGQVSEAYCIYYAPPLFSPDGNRLAYAVGKDIADHQIVVVDGETVSEYAGALCPTFSPDGKRMAYLKLEYNGVSKTHVVVDGRGGCQYDYAGGPVFSPDSKRLAYAVRQNQKWCIAVDGRLCHKYDDVDPPVFSPDSKRIAYRVKLGAKWLVVVDGRPGRRYDEAEKPMFSPNSKRVAYRARTDKKWIVAVDGQPSPEYDEIDLPVFSLDGQRIAYRAKKGQKWLIVVDGQAGPEYDDVKTPVFSPDGSRVAYCATTKPKWVVVVDGRAEAEYDGIGDDDNDNPLVFSADGKRVAYVATKDRQYVAVVDGQEHPGFDPVVEGDLSDYGVERRQSCRPVFSPDGKHVAFAARKGRASVVVDGQAGSEYDELIASPRFREDGTMVALAIRDGYLYRVEWSPMPKR